MGKWGKVIFYGSYITIILIILSILSPAAFAKSDTAAGKGADMQSLETVQARVKEKVQERNQTVNGTLEREQLREETKEKNTIKRATQDPEKQLPNLKAKFPPDKIQTEVWKLQ
ncbi:hypothetical protein [Methanosarcina horonobensis]|uniref:hypothetical protein n=1 Tax=Methanosarcina horonobensis TaxID=418008 RepID=UPI000B1E1F29|nr:hypothetical protein [Methanosarcina horonobensis]